MATHKTYAEKLKDPRWQKKRLEIMERDNFQCRYCRSKENTLNVHHRHYRKGAMPWDYENNQLVTLCQECHQEAEVFKSFICEKLGSNRRLDVRLLKLCMAMHEDPQNLTFFGWAADNLAEAIHHAIIIHENHEKDQQASNDSHRDLKNAVAECVENIHRALFHLQEHFPES